MIRKTCSHCKIEKDIFEFGKNKTQKDGLQNMCKSCYKIYRETHREKIKEIKRKEYQNNRDKIRARSKQRYENKKEEISIKSKIYRETHREEIKENSRKYREKNKDILKENKKIYYQNNKDDLIIKYEIYRESHKTERKEYNKKYYKTPDGKASKARDKHKRRSKGKNFKNDLTSEHWEEIIQMQNNLCAICRKPFTEDDSPTRDHIIPLSSLWCAGLTKGNVQATHAICNSRKREKIDLGNGIDNLLI